MSLTHRTEPAAPPQGGGGLYPAPLESPHPATPRFADMVIRQMRFLRGPSIWTYRPAMEAVVDIGALEDHPSNTLPGFYERLSSWLPGLMEHHCGVGERGGFLMRLREGTWPGHIMEHVALELQSCAGLAMGFGKARMTPEHGVYKVVIRTSDEAVGRLALESARDLVMAAINNTPYDVPAAIACLADCIHRHAPDPSAACIVDAAAERGIPAIALTGGSLVQLGYGAAQRRIWAAESDRTSAIAKGIADDKPLTQQLLGAAGLPVPESQRVRSAEQAWAAAQDIGLPVVVKPLSGQQALGISLNLHTQQDVHSAFAAADAEDQGVLVESFIQGHEHRLLIVGGHVVAAARAEAVTVQGDGRSSVADLLASQVNTDPRRGRAAHCPLKPLRPDDLALLLLLRTQGLTPESVLPAGHSATVQCSGNFCVDVTDQVHPDIAGQAALAARVLGLDIAGVDLVAQDIAQPLAAQRAAVLAVHAGPSLLPHLKPASGPSRPVGQAIAAHLFGQAESGRIPVIGLLGGADSATAAHILAALLAQGGQTVGLASQNGLFLGPRQLSSADATGFDDSQRLLINRKVQAAVLQTTPRALLNHGLPYDRCQVGVVMAMPGPEGLHDLYVRQPDQMPTVMRTQIDVVLPQGSAVLNADDAAVLALAQYSDGRVLLYSQQPDNPAVRAHCANRGRAVCVQDGQIMLLQGEQASALISLSHPGLAGLQAAQHAPVLAAVAAAWALDNMSPQLLRAGLLQFVSQVY